MPDSAAASDHSDPPRSEVLRGTVATGNGSWPGTDIREALRVVTGELAHGATPDRVLPVPYLPELPARGPGSDMLGRGAHLLVDLPVDLQPQGWRLVDHPGRDAERAAAWWRQDLDELAEALDGYAGPLKLQVTGPWTLAASLWKPLGDRVLSDRGAVHDLAESLAEGVAGHLARVRTLVPGAQLVLQVDEPSLPAVLLGRIRSESGYRTLPVPDRGEVVAALARVLGQEGAAAVGVHCCAGALPVDVLVEADAGFLALDVAQLGGSGWEQVAGAVEAGVRLWAGLDLAASDPPAGLLERWQQLGLPPSRLDDLGVTPTCGLAGATPDAARAATRAAVTVAARLAERAAG